MWHRLHECPVSLNAFIPSWHGAQRSFGGAGMSASASLFSTA